MSELERLAFFAIPTLLLALALERWTIAARALTGRLLAQMGERPAEELPPAPTEAEIVNLRPHAGPRTRVRFRGGR